MLQTVRKMSSIEWQELKNRIWPRFFVGPDVMVYLTCAVIGLGGRGVIKTWTESGCKSAPLHADVRSHLSGSSAIQPLAASEESWKNRIFFPSVFVHR